jgi:Fe-S-cluster containining protein
VPLLSPPPTARTADDLLPAARTLLDDFAASAAADPEIGITCGKACTACCHQAVGVSPAETRSIVSAVGRLEPGHRARIAQRAASAVQAFAGAGLGPDTFFGDANQTRRSALRYFTMGVPCPLLEDELCSVHGDRPLACREYLAASDPVHCASIDTHPERILHIRSSSDVKAGFRRISAEFGEPGPAVLVFALADALSATGPPAPPATDPRSGPAMAALLTPPRR